MSSCNEFFSHLLNQHIESLRPELSPLFKRAYNYINAENSHVIHDSLMSVIMHAIAVNYQGDRVETVIIITCNLLGYNGVDC